VMMTAPFPATEYAEVPYGFLADTFANTLDPQSTR
jgi:hypothetical protein